MINNKRLNPTRAALLAAMMAVMIIAGASHASAATRLGGVDLAKYCRDRYQSSYSSAKVVLVENNAYGWRCQQILLVGGPSWTNYSIDMVDVCRRQYGVKSVTAKYGSFSDAKSWSCYR